MAPQDGQGDPTENRGSLISNSTNKVIGALSEPRSFLLFIFAVLALIEYSNWTRTQSLVKTVVGIIETTTGTVSREQDFNRDMMEGMLRIIEDDKRKQQSQSQNQPPPTPRLPDLADPHNDHQTYQ